MKRTLVFALLACAGIACTQPSDPLEYVDPFIGTGFHGHTFPGAATPFGMVQLSPSNDFSSWKRCAGYHYDDDVIKGFAHTHISGAGRLGCLRRLPLRRPDHRRILAYPPERYGMRRPGRHPLPPHHPRGGGARRRLPGAALHLLARQGDGLVRLLLGRTARRGADGRADCRTPMRSTATARGA